LRIEISWTINNPKENHFMRHFRVGRLAASVVMLGSTLGLAGGTLLATAGPASADSGGTNTCTGFSGSADLSAQIPLLTGTLTGCHQQGSGALTGVLDITGATAPGSVFWVTGHATSVITFSAVIDLSGGPCPPGDIAAAVTIMVGGGPYQSGTPGGGELCADPSGFPVIALSSFGNVVI
jgi:hypothetical protein